LNLYEPFKLFTSKECKSIIKHAKSSKNAQGLAAGKYDPNIRNNHIYWYDYPESGRFYPLLQSIKGYNVTWIQEPIQVSQYKEGKFYSWHGDQFVNRRTSARILTLTCTLQEAPGALFETKEHRFDLKEGEAVIIPSTDIHRALPPISGERWSLTVWGMGANPNL